MIVVIKTIYRRTMRHRPLLCTLFLTFGISFYLVYVYSNDDLPVDPNQYDNAITFWSNDYHIR
jgi:hypothetical protein